MRKPEIKNVVYDNKKTRIYWSDGTMTQSECQGEDEYSKFGGFLLARAKKFEETPEIISDLDKWVYSEPKKKQKTAETKKQKKPSCTKSEAKEVSDAFDEIISDMIAEMAMDIILAEIFQPKLHGNRSRRGRY